MFSALDSVGAQSSHKNPEFEMARRRRLRISAVVDRRDARRFPLETEIRWRPLAIRGEARPGKGKTINMSSNGVLFTTEAPLKIGTKLELSIHWPVALNATCPLKLVTQGRVTRTLAESAAVHIDRYEFRTRGTREE